MNTDSHLIFEALKNRVVKKNDDEEGDLMTHMKEKGMIPKDARVTLPAHKTEEEEKDSFDTYVDQLKNTSTEELIEDLKDLYRIVADEKNVGDYSYDSANLDIEIIHDILKSRGLDYQKDLAPIWNKIDGEVNGTEENAEDSALGAFTVVSGGVDNTSDTGFDISEIYPVNARNLKDAAHIIMKDMTHEDRDFGTNFPHKYRQFKKDVFIMSNDNGDFVAVLPGSLSEEQIFDKLVSVRDASEEAEDMSKSPFHYDPSHGLMQAANQINDILKSSYNDEATPEHIEKMALKILGPQSEYRDYHEFNLALLGVKALLNRYVNTEMN